MLFVVSAESPVRGKRTPIFTTSCSAALGFFPKKTAQYSYHNNSNANPNFIFHINPSFFEKF